MRKRENRCRAAAKQKGGVGDTSRRYRPDGVRRQNVMTMGIAKRTGAISNRGSQFGGYRGKLFQGGRVRRCRQRGPRRGWRHDPGSDCSEAIEVRSKRGERKNWGKKERQGSTVRERPHRAAFGATPGRTWKSPLYNAPPNPTNGNNRQATRMTIRSVNRAHIGPQIHFPRTQVSIDCRVARLQSLFQVPDTRSLGSPRCQARCLGTCFF